jgi:hypothetical protein
MRVAKGAIWCAVVIASARCATTDLAGITTSSTYSGSMLTINESAPDRVTQIVLEQAEFVSAG